MFRDRKLLCTVERINVRVRMLGKLYPVVTRFTQTLCALCPVKVLGGGERDYVGRSAKSNVLETQLESSNIA